MRTSAVISVPFLEAERIARVPPTNRIRSRMPAKPIPLERFAGSNPTPESETVSLSRVPRKETVIDASRAWLCFTTLFIASWQTRNRHSEISSGKDSGKCFARTVTAMPCCSETC